MNQNELNGPISIRNYEMLIDGESYKMLQKFIGYPDSTYSGGGDVVISWNFLMPLVEKIAERYNFTIQFYSGDCNCFCEKQAYGSSDIPGIGHGGFKPNIQSVYKSVVAFVKWYNVQKSKGLIVQSEPE